MTEEQFNALSLHEQFTFFRESLGDRRCGLFNLLLFEDKAIIAQFKQSGKPEHVHAYPVPAEGREIARKNLKKIGYPCTVAFWNSIEDADKSAIMGKFIHHYQSKN